MWTLGQHLKYYSACDSEIIARVNFSVFPEVEVYHMHAPFLSLYQTTTPGLHGDSMCNHKYSEDSIIQKKRFCKYNSGCSRTYFQLKSGKEKRSVHFGFQMSWSLKSIYGQEEKITNKTNFMTEGYLLT